MRVSAFVKVNITGGEGVSGASVGVGACVLVYLFVCIFVSARTRYVYECVFSRLRLYQRNEKYVKPFEPTKQLQGVKICTATKFRCEVLYDKSYENLKLYGHVLTYCGHRFFFLVFFGLLDYCDVDYVIYK
jgi:hypothetical protein